jgi:hypothetical protein
MGTIGADVSKLLLDLVYVVSLVAIGAAASWFRAHTTAVQRALLGELAAAAVPFVEREFRTLSGAMKAAKAVSIVLVWLRKRGIAITLQEVEAAVEAAYAQAEKNGILAVYAPPPAPAPTGKTAAC